MLKHPLDVEIRDANPHCSPQSVSTAAKLKTGGKENGVVLGEIDEASRARAESRFFSYFQLHVDPDPNAQGPASFN